MLDSGRHLASMSVSTRCDHDVRHILLLLSHCHRGGMGGFLWCCHECYQLYSNNHPSRVVPSLCHNHHHVAASQSCCVLQAGFQPLPRLIVQHCVGLCASVVCSCENLKFQFVSLEFQLAASNML